MSSAPSLERWAPLRAVMGGEVKGPPTSPFISLSITTGWCCSASPLLWRRSLVRVLDPRRSQSTGWTTEESFSVRSLSRAHSSLFHSRRWSMTCRGQLSDQACLGPGVPKSDQQGLLLPPPDRSFGWRRRAPDRTAAPACFVCPG